MVFLATIYHAVSYLARGTLLKRSPTTFILRTLYFDGAIYYLVSCSILYVAGLIALKIILSLRVAVLILVSYNHHFILAFDQYCLIAIWSH